MLQNSMMMINFMNKTNQNENISQTFEETVDFSLDTNPFDANVDIDFDDASNLVCVNDNYSKNLEYKEYISICEQVYNSFKYNKNIKSAVCTFMINIKDLLSTGQEDIINTKKDDPCLGLIKKMIKCYHEIFTSSSTPQTNLQSLQLPPPNPNHAYYTNKRHNPNVESQQKRKRVYQRGLSQQSKTSRKKLVDIVQGTMP